ncbi:hypothetical protein [Microcoleus sp. SVA1B1]|uniref:hypothetical protein n=1 Tax=Microcoleus sp. SVA1B1 TaxID=3055422 RepID=UPI002FD70749
MTSPKGFIGICAEGAILCNTNEIFKTNWTKNYYFKNQGCLSIVDLVNNKRPRVTRRKMVSDYRIFQQASPVVVFLFLSPTVYPRVIDWRRYKKDRAYGQQIVPELESGVPEKVLLSEIDEAWFITLRDRVALAKEYGDLYASLQARSRSTATE